MKKVFVLLGIDVYRCFLYNDEYDEYDDPYEETEGEESYVLGVFSTLEGAEIAKTKETAYDKYIIKEMPLHL